MAIEKEGSKPVALAQKPLLDAFPVRHVLGLLQRNERLSDEPAPSREIADEYRKEQADIPISTKSEEIESGTSPSQLDDASQGSCSSKREDADALSCPKCRKTFLSGASLRKHLARLYPCDQPRSVILSGVGKVESKTCVKCDKIFSSWQGLRKHLNRVKPCDQEKIVSTVLRRQPPASRTCFKCGKTFSSPQSLRIHMNRVKPCDYNSNNGLDPPTSSGTTPPATSGTTPSTTSGTTPPTTLTLMSSGDVRKEVEGKAKARYQARKAYLKKRGRLGELGEPPSAICQSGEDVSQTKETEPELDSKRNALDEMVHEGGNVGLFRRRVKRPRVQEEPTQQNGSANSPSDVSGLAQPRTRISPHTTTSKKASTTEGSFVHRPNKEHGGDLLAGGCSCPPCVRRWARKLMNRMQQLEDEVLMLRQKESTGAATTTRAASTKSHVGPEATEWQSKNLHRLATNTGDSAIGVVSSFQAEPADIFKSLVNFSNTAATFRPLESGVSNSVASTKPSVLLQSNGQSLHAEDRLGGLQRVDGGDEHRSVNASVLQGVINSDTKSLMDAYKHMNDQILLNERAIKESSGHVQDLLGYSPTTAMDLREQVNELRAPIGAEITKRDVAVAALIADVWRPRREEFKALLNVQSQSSPRDEQVCYAKWAEIANQIVMKDKVISELERQMEALGQSGRNGRSRYAEMGALSSKIAAEFAAKIALEREREGFYVGLVKFNTRIRSLVRDALL